MSNDKYFRLVKKLIERTSQGLAEWHATSQERYFQLEMGSSVIQLGLDYNYSLGGEDVLTLVLYDQLGDEIDKVQLEDLVDMSDTPAIFRREMRTLYDEARRRALGVDKVLDDLLNKLGE